MDFLVLSPPVLPPSEPPSGAFLLAAGLAGSGKKTGFLDLSIAFFHHLLRPLKGADRNALDYLLNTATGYTPEPHRSAAGRLHAVISVFEQKFPGWKLTLMDIAPPGRVHHPLALAAQTDAKDPFTETYETCLGPILSERKPRSVLISLAYLSQLPAAVSLHRFLENRGISAVVGGSLPNSLNATGHGFTALQAVFPCIVLGDGSALLDNSSGLPLVDRIAWPELLGDAPYLSCRPVLPLLLSTGCYWNRCLFCPDRDLPYHSVPTEAIRRFLAEMPDEIRKKGPVIHLLDSALPPKSLRAFLPAAAENGVRFFGFARPTAHLLKDNLLEDAADAGCIMLQLGAEGGAFELLDRFDKGLRPEESTEVIQRSAAAGIRTYLYLLFGLPRETDEDRQKTLKWAEALGDSVDFLNLSLFNLPRFCELTCRAEEFGIQPGDYPPDPEGEGIRLYRPFSCDGTDPKETARRFLKTFRAVPNIRAAHLQTPRWFRAAHPALMRLIKRRDP